MIFVKFWQQINFYKSLLVFFWCLNVFVIAAGLVLGISYFTKQRDMEVQFKTALETQEKIERLNVELLPFTEEKIWEGSQWMAFATWLSEWKKIGGEVPADGLSSARPPFEYFQMRLERMRLENWRQLSNSRDDIGRYRIELLWVAGLTLIFGMLGPVLLSWRLKAASKGLQEKIEEEVVTALRVWQAKSSEYPSQEEAFQNPRFWADMALITLSRSTQWWHSPLSSYVENLALRLQREFQKFDADGPKKNSFENKGQVS